VSLLSVSPTAMGLTPLLGLPMATRRAEEKSVKWCAGSWPVDDAVTQLRMEVINKFRAPSSDVRSASWRCDGRRPDGPGADM
jgi:hypothetical protein